MTTKEQAEKKEREAELRRLWEIFDRGDALTTPELHMLQDSANAALEYLDARRERFVSFKTLLDLQRIEGYLRWRERK